MTMTMPVPGNAYELYEKLMHTPDLCGQFYIVNAYELQWSIYKDLTVSIGIGQRDADVVIERKIWGRIPDVLTHWHSKPSEIYGEICNIGCRGNVLVIRKNLFGETVLYAGAETNFPYSLDKKWYWGRIYYLKAE